MRIPALPLEMHTALKTAHYFNWWSQRVLRFYPKLESQLIQIDANIRATEFISVCLFAAFLNGTVITWFVYIMSLNAPKQLADPIYFALAIGAITAIFAFALSITYPKIVLGKRIKGIEQNLLFAARQLAVQSGAGVPIYHAFAGLSKGYGVLSNEVKKIIRMARTGKSFGASLEDNALRNPSLPYRRTLWQLANIDRTGVEPEHVLDEVVFTLAEEQKIALKNYEAQLQPLSLFYLVTTVIGPALGIVFLMVITSIANIPLNNWFYAAILGGMCLSQFFLIGLIESRRPNSLVY